MSFYSLQNNKLDNLICLCLISFNPLIIYVIAYKSVFFFSRMIPPTNKDILVNNLAAGTNYDLCVLAIYDDQVTSLTATRVIGCVHFTTEPQYLRCHFMQSQFLGGTIVVIIGGIIVASVLSFIIFLIVRYRVCNQGEADKVSLPLVPFVLSVYASLSFLKLKQGCLKNPTLSLPFCLYLLMPGSGDGGHSVTEQ